MVLEGPEGAGKTTLAALLAKRLEEEGSPAVMVREPGGTAAAEALRAELLSDSRAWTPEAELLYICAARADLVAKVIRPALERGQVVISDRYELSTVAYQGAGRGIPLTIVDWVNRAATGGLKPDLTVVLDLPPEVGRERQIVSGKPRDRLDRESEAFHHRVAAAYREARQPGLVHLDATPSVEVLAERCWQALVDARSTQPRAGR
jgi:dTMP kinase